jgi:hypothetical protein
MDRDDVKAIVLTGQTSLASSHLIDPPSSAPSFFFITRWWDFGLSD